MKSPRNKIATIVPFHHLDLTKDDQYFMALSYLIGDETHGDEYAKFFSARSHEGKYIVLDNSAVEMGAPESFEDYFFKAKLIEASCIMLPDHFQDPSATYEAATEAMTNFRNLISHFDMDVMVIPQGKNYAEWMASAIELQELVIAHKCNPVLGISCRYTDMFNGTRALAVLQGLYSRPNINSVKIHLLGCYADPRIDVAPFLGYRFIQGVDSSYPSIYSQKKIRMEASNLANRPAREIDFINDVYDQVLLLQNIETWKTACEPISV